MVQPRRCMSMLSHVEVSSTHDICTYSQAHVSPGARAWDGRSFPEEAGIGFRAILGCISPTCMQERSCGPTRTKSGTSRRGPGGTFGMALPVPFASQAWWLFTLLSILHKYINIYIYIYIYISLFNCILYTIYIYIYIHTYIYIYIYIGCL